ncbi:monovalent cation/H+ antiporter subunit E [Natronolimnohabitans sp. A-GB9]|uniref:monovalent cation/H+ antiporter subunit E n=1 Tax=Natronolimnohabitans sp. A-GB9 TaxID=3069757 RepID=UPI0027B73F77|nr:monovalent cation/H+ antiporter subunit E [Natronolimnohabitans sp. A-GB9]MDQ2052141.1 monovalent cation/H+ antiporter subunit E [Natronolimnohabitans sp. A-GB9]
MSDRGGILVPVAPSSTLEETVSYAVDVARETDGGIHLVRTVPGHHVDRGTLETDERVLERAERRAREAAPDEFPVTSALLGADQYIAGPAEHVELFLEYAYRHALDRIVVDPDYSIDATAPTLQSLESLLDDAAIEYERAPVAEPSVRPTWDELVRGGVVGIVAFGFYLALGGTVYGLLDPFVLGSAVVTALIAAGLLRNVAFETTPTAGPLLSTIGRGIVFVPYLLWEITKANVLFAYVVLHPKLPIDPRLDRVDAAVGSGMSVTAFANSITLTPGTLTVDADGHCLLVHSLNASAQEDLFDGVHERAVRYLFYGREGLELPGPAERGDASPIIGPDAPESEDGGAVAAEPSTGGDDDE